MIVSVATAVRIEIAGAMAIIHGTAARRDGAAQRGPRPDARAVDRHLDLLAGPDAEALAVNSGYLGHLRGREEPQARRVLGRAACPERGCCSEPQPLGRLRGALELD